MATRRDRQQARTRQRHKQRRGERQASRRERNQRASAGYGEAGHSWEPGEAFLSEDWHTAGSRVAAVFTRTNGEDAYGYVAFEVELAGDGLVSLDTAVPTGLGNAQAIAAERGGERSMLVVDAASAALLFQQALEVRREAGLKDLAGTGDAVALIGQVDTDLAEFDVIWGDPVEDDPTEEVPRVGLIDRLSGWFGR